MLKSTNCMLGDQQLLLFPRRRRGPVPRAQSHVRERRLAGRSVRDAPSEESCHAVGRVFPRRDRVWSSYGLGAKLVRAPRVIYSMQARHKMSRLLGAIQPQIAHVHNIYHHLSPSFLPLLKQHGIRVVMTVHDLKLACPAYTMMFRRQAVRTLPRRQALQCGRQSLHQGIACALQPGDGRVRICTGCCDLYEANIDRFIVPSRFLLEKLVQWGWARERFVYIPNFVDIERFKPGSGRPAFCLLRPAGRAEGRRDSRAGRCHGASAAHAGRQRTA